MSSKSDMKKTYYLGPDLSNPKLTSIIQKISILSSLAFPPVYFPDLTLKDRTESPSSFAAATNGTIIPELSAPSLGCSMGVIATSLTRKDLTPKFFRNFYNAIQEELGKNYNFWENISVWLGLRKRNLKKYDLTETEFEDIIKHGAEAAIIRYGYNKSLLDKIEHGGSVFTAEELKNLDLHNILPRSSFTNGRHDLGYGFKGNHFLEFQYVEDILEPEKVRKLGLESGQIVIMYHGGGGMVPYHVGRYYANRKKNTIKQKMFLFVGKLLFHFASFDGIKNFITRLKYYFLPHPFREIPLNSGEGKRLMLANKAALNYSYAFNVAILRRVEDALVKSFPSKNIDVHLIAAKIHNSIFSEEISGKRVLVHRHTANIIVPDKFNLVSGYNNTNSFLVIGRKEAEKYLNSADHGSGSVIKRLLKNGTSSKKPDGGKTYIFTTKPPYEEVVDHITSEGIDYVIDKLKKEKIVTPAVRLTPLAVFKG